MCTCVCISILRVNPSFFPFYLPSSQSLFPSFITTVDYRVYIQISLRILPGRMAEEQPAPGPPHVPSQEDPASLDIEELVRATKLCDTCHPMFDDLLASMKRSIYTSVYMSHHPSCDSLRQSVEAGCVICTPLYEIWQSCSSSERHWYLRARSDVSRYPGGRGVSFYYTILPFGLSLDVGPSDILDLEDAGTFDTLFLVYIERCK